MSPTKPNSDKVVSTTRSPWIRIAGLVLIALLLALPAVWLVDRISNSFGQGRGLAQAESRQREQSSFNFELATIPVTEIFSGGPPKDGIPALSKPRMVKAPAAGYLKPDDRVIGVFMADEARAYPLRILNYHEIVNDQVGDMPIAVTYCPLCDSVSVFDRTTPRGVREFGVSGLLYNSNVLMYDRSDQPESLWSQLKSTAVTGPQVGNQLQLLPCELTIWSDWQTHHPSTLVLSNETGHQRDYSNTPYRSYFDSPSLMFPAQPLDDRLPNKEKVLGVIVGEESRAYPSSEFSEDRQRVKDEINGKRVVIEFDPSTGSLRVAEADAGVQWMYSFWFAWHAMYPETKTFAPIQ